MRGDRRRIPRASVRRNDWLICDALAKGGKVKGILALTRAIFGKSGNDVIASDSRTLKEVVETLYNDGRSKIAHGGTLALLCELPIELSIADSLTAHTSNLDFRIPRERQAHAGVSNNHSAEIRLNRKFEGRSPISRTLLIIDDMRFSHQSHLAFGRNLSIKSIWIEELLPHNQSAWN
jgi:hypothetical protein